MRKEILLHKKMEALRMGSGQSQIFVEIEAGGVREIEIAYTMKRDQFFVQSKRSAAGGQPKNNS